jgi:hypothetical protein
MRKWLGIGMLSVVVAAGLGMYWVFTKSRTARHEPNVEAARVESSKDDGNAEPSDVIEPLVVQGLRNPPADDSGDLVLRTDPPAPAIRLRADMPLPPRPDVELGVVKRMPMADEEPVGGVWFFLDWSMIQAKLSELNIFKEAEKDDPASNSANKETNPPTEVRPVPDYHQQHPHCPYHGPCPSPYRWLPRD